MSVPPRDSRSLSVGNIVAVVGEVRLEEVIRCARDMASGSIDRFVATLEPLGRPGVDEEHRRVFQASTDILDAQPHLRTRMGCEGRWRSVFLA